jgi:hypothetical protein
MSKLQIDRHDIFCFQKRYKFGNGVIRLKHDFTSFFVHFPHRHFSINMSYLTSIFLCFLLTTVIYDIYISE